MWASIAEPGRLTLINGSSSSLQGFLQELAHYFLQEHEGQVLWCDSDHSFHPDEFAELNLTRGRNAETHAKRMVVRRCLTPFQWYTTMSRHIQRDLDEAPTGLVIASPFDRPLSTDELADWEQEDYTRFLIPHLKNLAHDREVPIVLGIDMARWWRSHPVLAQVTHDGVDERWSVGRIDGRWRLARSDGMVHDPLLRNRVTLLDYLAPEDREDLPVPILVRAGTPRSRRRTRIVYPTKTFSAGP
jgi:hypothetical protein